MAVGRPGPASVRGFLVHIGIIKTVTFKTFDCHRKTLEIPCNKWCQILLISSDVLAVVSAVVPKSGWQGQHFWRFCGLATNVGLVQEARGQGLHRSRSQGHPEDFSDRESLSPEGWQGPLYVDRLDCGDSG